MRTVPYINVFNRIVRKLGRDPFAEIPQDMARAIDDHVNDRVRQICQAWPWPDWELTEERAFRQVWNDSRQFLRASVIDGKPDEVFYIPETTYWKVNVDAVADPPIGEIPSASSIYWTQIEDVDTFIDYDQVCRRAIGMVRGIYSVNPRMPTGSNNGLLQFMPSEKGIDVRYPSGATVFLHYSMPVPRFTIVPYVVGRLYARADVAFDPGTGETFQALDETASLLSDTDFWRRVPFPEKWATWVVEGAFSDCLYEFDQGGNDDLQAKALLAEKAQTKAEDALDAEVNALAAQGQVLKYGFCQRRTGWIDTQPWSGGTVSELTDECQDELGWVYPQSVLEPQVRWQFRNEIVSFYGTAPNVIQVPTRSLQVGSIIEWVEGPTGTRVRHSVQLLAGTADSTDPGQKNPLDYNASSNNKHWELVS